MRPCYIQRENRRRPEVLSRIFFATFGLGRSTNGILRIAFAFLRTSRGCIVLCCCMESCNKIRRNFISAVYLIESQSGTIIKDVFVKSKVMADDPTKKALDRKFVSQQPHEQAYQKRKNKQSGKTSERKTGRSRTSK